MLEHEEAQSLRSVGREEGKQFCVQYVRGSHALNVDPEIGLLNEANL